MKRIVRLAVFLMIPIALLKPRNKVGCVVALFMLSAWTASALDVRVMSYNIRYGTAGDGANDWSNRRELLIVQLRTLGPELIGMQEALRFQIDEVREALPHFGEVGIGRDGGEKGEYSCILYDTRRFEVVDSGTFWLSETPEKRSQNWGSACVRICTWALLADRKTGETFIHYNTHLDHQSAEARLRSVQLINKRIAAGTADVPFVLTGDFNAPETSPPLKFLKKEHLIDTFRVLHPNAVEVGTFNRFKGDKSGAKIDYILVEPGTKVIEAGIDFTMPQGRCISDHFPVTATLNL